ncbi:hypothetical protein MPSI1_000756 [Malassezia psittaci]|uniref:Transcription factor n=1 Tax=Malassezia psittaci TaxID=1821823 RepID=A0AAF0JCY8_9BASI|nr:hypothetical protein MPSI1_000756 [Malassezia psittaci]
MDEEALRAMLPGGFGKQEVVATKKRKADAVLEPEQLDSPDTHSVSKTDSYEEVKSQDARHELEVIDAEGSQENLLSKEHSKDLDTSLNSKRHDPSLLPEGLTAEFGGAPLDQHIELQDHTKTISALAVDPSGTRVATGSHDYQVKLWDFGGMTQSFRPFRAFEPAENYPVVQLAYSPVSRNLLCINATTEPRVYDFQGEELASYKKGNVFMRDMKHTNGHVSEMICGNWHPTEANTFLTGGSDSTLRVWDVDFQAGQKIVIVVRSKQRGTKTKVTATTYTPDGKAILAACQDGALHVWSTNGSYSRPSMSIERAHAVNEGASCIAIASDNTTIATRGNDDTVKVWDLRQLKSPLASRENVPIGSEHSDIVFSPNGQQVITGTAAVPAAARLTSTPDALDDLLSEWGQIAVFSRDDLSLKHVHPVGKSSVTRLLWQPRINQILAGTRNGTVNVYYDNESSQLGALLGVKRSAKVRSNPFGIEELPGGVTADVPIFMPEDKDQDYYELDEPKRQYLEWKEAKNRIRRDPIKTKLPQMPIRGQGYGGRVGKSANTHLVQGMYEGQAALRMQDPREALLKYADKADKNPRWTSIYSKTQPKTIFSEETGDEE